MYLPEDAEFYFVYGGSHQRHVVIADRVQDNVLQSSIPGEKAGWGGKHPPSRDICQVVNHKGKEDAFAKVRSSQGCMCMLLGRTRSPVPVTPGAPLLVSALA